MEEQRNFMELADMGFATPENCQFYVEYGNFLAMKFKDEEYHHLRLHRALPLVQPEQFISVQDIDAKEIALIRDMREFSPEQQAILQVELDRRYFCPEVLSIQSVKDKMGYLYFEVLTSVGIRSFAVADVTRSIRKPKDADHVTVVDVDGNRYFIPDIKSFPKNSLKKIKSYIF